MILSRNGALLEHIPPLPRYTYPINPNYGENNVRAFMQEFIDYYRLWESYFFASSSMVICAEFEGEVALPGQQAIIVTALRGAGLHVDHNHTYSVPFIRYDPDNGTVLVDSRTGNCEVYVGQERVVHFSLSGGN